MDTSVRQPVFHMPFTARANPHLEQTRRRVKQWAHQVGLLAPEYTTAWPERWSERTFEKADFPLWTAMTHPDAGADELNLVTDWHVALWFVDDLFLPLFRSTTTTRPPGARWKDCCGSCPSMPCRDRIWCPRIRWSGRSPSCGPRPRRR